MEITACFQIVVIFVLCGSLIQARIVPPNQDKEGFGCRAIKGQCCAQGSQYRLGEVMIEKSGDETCKMFICTDDNFKLLEEIHCTADDIYVTETKALMKHIKSFVKQLNQNRKDKFRITTNDRLGYHRIQQKQKRYETTVLPPTPTPTPGCYGFSQTTGRSGNWCYGTYCDQNGNVIHWDNFNCVPTTPITIPPTTSTPFFTTPPTTPFFTTPTTTPFFTTPLYCIYKHNGHFSFHKGGSSFVNLDGVKCECTFYGRIECDPDNVVG